MAENEEKNENQQENKKSKSSNVITVIIVVAAISLIMTAASFVVIINGVLQVITSVVNDIMDFISNPLESIEEANNYTINSINYVLNLPWYQRDRGKGCTIILDDSAVETIKENIKNQAIDTDSTGLSDVLLKKMILVNYMTTCTVDTEVAIPIEEEDLAELFDGHLDWDIHFNAQEGIFMYWAGNGKGRGEENKLYMSVKGIVKLVDENGDYIVSYDQDGLDKIVNDFKDRYNANKNNSLDNMRYNVEHSYMMETPGTIKIAKVKTIDTTATYKYGDKNLVEENEVGSFESEYVSLNYSQYISQYAMPMDFLVSLLELTGSDKFVEAVCDLVGESEIKVVVAANESICIENEATGYLYNLTVEGLQPIQTDSTENYKYQKVSIQELATDRLISGEKVNVIKELETTTKDTQYSIFVKEVNTWYCKAMYKENDDWYGSFISIDDGGNENPNERDYSDIDQMYKELDEAKKSRNWISQNGEKETNVYPYYDESINPNNLEEIYNSALDSGGINNKIDEDKIDEAKHTMTSERNELIFRANLLKEICTSKNFFKPENLNKNYTPPKNYGFGFPRVTKLIEEKICMDKSSFRVIREKQIAGNSIATQYEDKTDKFLGLLKNDTGLYKKDANFKSDGQIVYYPDVYKGMIPVGELLVDGEEVLYQLMESTSSYNKGLEHIMKYILKRYKGENVTAEDFDNAINWLKQINFKTNSGKSIISDFLASWENGALWLYKNGKISDYKSNPYIYECITEDKKYYIMTDDLYTGNNNRNYGFGVCFYVGYAEKFQNENYFKEEGIDITDEKYNKYGESKIEVEIVDRIKEKIIEDLRNEVGIEIKSRGLILEEYQIHALMALRYQGWYISDFLDAYKNNNCKIDESLRKYSPGMGDSTDRYKANWKLFSEGKYMAGDGSELNPEAYSAGSILEVAEVIHKYMEDNHYSYCLLGGENNSHSGECGLDQTFEESKTNHHLTCCATFVSWVLRDAGYINETQHGAITLARILQEKYNFTKVNISDLQPGDIIFYSYGHIEIYAGDGQIYNAGGVDSIQCDSPYTTNGYLSATYGLRAPKK